MAHGDVLLSPYVCEFSDYLQRRLIITLNFSDSTRALLSGSVHRDADCLWTHIVWDDPNGVNRKPLPAVPAGDTSFTANQIRSATGFRTIEDVLAVQITAEA
jgi:hypothetical protein